MKLICILAFLLISLASAKLDVKKVVYAVDCGSERPFKSPSGITFQADQGYSPETKAADYSVNPEAGSATVKYTQDQPVYMTERHGDDTFYYDLPVKTPGSYVVISKFAEMWHREPRKRIFNIMLGSCMGENGVDIFAKVGRFAAYDSYIQFELKDDGVYIKGEKCKGAYQNGKVRVSYVKIGFDNPKVDAIILFKGTLAETDFNEIPAMRKEYDRRLEEEIRRKEEEKLRKEESKYKRREKVKIRNDDYDDLQEDFEDIDVQFVAKRSLADYVSDYFGLIILGAVAFAIIYPLLGKAEADQALIEELSEPRKKSTEREKKESKKKK